jgi:hypothetical protein
MPLLCLKRDATGEEEPLDTRNTNPEPKKYEAQSSYARHGRASGLPTMDQPAAFGPS